MTAPNTAIVKLEGSKGRIRKLMRDINGRAHKLVRGTEGVIYAEMPSQELSWMDKIAHDIGVKKLEVWEFPKHEQAPCGVYTVEVGRHKGKCKSCQAILSRKRPHDGEARVVAKLEGAKSLDELSLNGLVGLMKGKMDEALQLAQEYDTVIKAVEKIPELNEQMKKLNEQVSEHKSALKYFTANVK